MRARTAISALLGGLLQVVSPARGEADGPIPLPADGDRGGAVVGARRIDEPSVSDPARFFAARARCAPQTCADQVLILDFRFAKDSDALDARARRILDAVTKAMSDPGLSQSRFEIDGHADASGEEVYNQQLSERRAAAVTLYLSSRGVDLLRLIGLGMGSKHPLARDPYSSANRAIGVKLLNGTR